MFLQRGQLNLPLGSTYSKMSICAPPLFFFTSFPLHAAQHFVVLLCALFTVPWSHRQLFPGFSSLSKHHAKV